MDPRRTEERRGRSSSSARTEDEKAALLTSSSSSFSLHREGPINQCWFGCWGVVAGQKDSNLLTFRRGEVRIAKNGVMLDFGREKRGEWRPGVGNRIPREVGKASLGFSGSYQRYF